MSFSDAGYDVTLSGDPGYGACDLVAHLEDDVVLVHLGHAPVDQTHNGMYEIYPLDFNPDWPCNNGSACTLASVQKLLVKKVINQ
jgi:diphthamide biosynthesis enzyme Dph1/Dph2-like protein